MNTNAFIDPNITDLGLPRVCEHMPPAISGSDKEPPVSTELCSERLGTELMAFLKDIVPYIATDAVLRRANELRQRVMLAGIRERK